MNILNVFKPKWSAQKITDTDRQKLFWYLRRKTSYSAWQRLADRFDNFANVFEKQAREEPFARAEGTVDGTPWERFFVEIVKGQVLFERGLAALRCGDRTVWLYNDRGLLDDAGTIAGSWYVDLVNHGMRGDHYYEGKYVSELTEAISAYSLAAYDTAGVIQPMMAETPAPYAWSTFWKDDFASLPLPSTLPDVPIPDTEILVKTGEVIPVFGIYEPQIKDGCMNYLLAGVPAPTMWDIDGTNYTDRKLSVTWRLIWADTRYIDGEIPKEEELYFPPERPTEAVKLGPLAEELLSAATSEKCPRSGEWAVMDDLDAKSVLAEGQRMPAHQAREVTWVWLQK